MLAVGRPLRVHAGLTGYGGQAADFGALIGEPLGVNADAISPSNDAEVAHLDLFKRGEGYLVYAGTGSIATFIDGSGGFHRAGGLGGLLDDGGSGYWIGREALRHIWRREDESPGAWQHSPMAHAVFQRLGGSEWTHTRHFVSTAERGDIGRLALAVAATADSDAQALRILEAAGAELARLGPILIARHGPRPIDLAGRALQLHPAIERACRAGLPGDVAVQRRSPQGHHAAARITAGLLPSWCGPWRGRSWHDLGAAAPE